MNIPEIINAFNIYKDGAKLVGVSDEVKLPELDALTETVRGAGILGEYEAPNPGCFGALDFEIPFRVLYGDIFEVVGGEKANLTLRGSIQTDDGTGQKKRVGLRVVVSGAVKKLTPGTVAAGKPMGAAVTISANYLMIEADGVTEFELDKLNSIYKVHGVDRLAEIAALC